MKRTPESHDAKRGDRRLYRGIAAALLAASCGMLGASDIAKTPEPGVSIYETPDFRYPLGKVVSFAVECADYKDLSRRSLQPIWVNWYKVVEDPPMQNPPLEGYINPRHRFVVTGTAPQCT